MSSTPQPPAMHVRGATTYFNTHVQSRTPVEMVVMLYDGALRQLGQAKRALVDNDLVTKRDTLSRRLAIVTELQGMLNLEAGGEIAASLDGLYTYIHGCCLDANPQRNPARLDEALRLLTTLRSAWAEIAAAPQNVALNPVRGGWPLCHRTCPRYSPTTAPASMPPCGCCFNSRTWQGVSAPCPSPPMPRH